jgi:hypothetical protein
MRIFQSLSEKISLALAKEARYLVANPDVYEAVKIGDFSTGREHYLSHGKSEGRKYAVNIEWSQRPSQFIESTSRVAFASEIMASTQGHILEIGPLNLPIVAGPRCQYFDIVPTSQLKIKAIAAGLNPDTVPDINYFHPTGDLSVVPLKFDAVVSAHCIEHQPDLIQHLIQVSALLNKGGKYFLVIPDQRYCFDHFLPPSRIKEVIEAHLEKRKMPSEQSIIEHHVFVTHNDPVRHWNGDHGSGTENVLKKWESAVELVSKSKGEYVDVHCWQFQPKAFEDLITNLSNLGHISFKINKVFSTAKNNLEFFAVLEKQ